MTAPQSQYLPLDRLPNQPTAWQLTSTAAHESCSLQQYKATRTWQWNDKTIYFFCDIHADADAFLLSLAASGGIEKTGREDHDFELTATGRKALFIIGGDCFDKGPSTLRLLDLIYCLKQKAADLLLLAGNHDVRTYLGMFYAENQQLMFDHLFVRMGTKTIPLLEEIYLRFVQPEQRSRRSEESALKARLFPDETWFENFPTAARTVIRPASLAKEVRRVREKGPQMEQLVASRGLDFSQIFQAVQKFKELFLEPGSRYRWFFDSLQLAHREGSYLFVHGGMDDSMAQLIASRGLDHVNQSFMDQLKDDPFSLYHGTIGNVFRTKYRSSDYAFTDQGTKLLNGAGIHAIVHGHLNLTGGQRLVIRNDMLNFECDSSVDCNTRKLEQLNGPGGAVVIFESDGTVKGISTDHNQIKTFHPEAE